MWQQYVDLGISVIPLFPQSKQPHFQRLLETGWFVQKPNDEGVLENRAVWGPAQKSIASESILAYWFRGLPEQVGVALIGGDVSGRLAYVDFDNLRAYRRWAVAHRTAAHSTAIQKTARGYHVFFRLGSAADLHGGVFTFEGGRVGEVRGEGMYVACAPSYHPSGQQYRWAREPGGGILEIEDWAEIDLELVRQVGGESSERQVERVITDEDSVQWARRQLKRLHSWRADDYEEWLRVGMALSQLGDQGLALWEEWSRQSGKYTKNRPDTLRKKWDSFTPGAGITLATLAWQADQDDPATAADRQVKFQGRGYSTDYVRRYGRKWKTI